MILFFFSKQKTAYDMRISDWSSDVCSSDLPDRSTTMIWLRFESHLAAEPPSVWLHATQMRGVNAELSPLVRMSVPQAYACMTLRDAPQGDRKSTRLNSSH